MTLNLQDSIFLSSSILGFNSLSLCWRLNCSVRMWECENLTWIMISKAFPPPHPHPWLYKERNCIFFLGNMHIWVLQVICFKINFWTFFLLFLLHVSQLNNFWAMNLKWRQLTLLALKASFASPDDLQYILFDLYADCQPTPNMFVA